MASNYNFLRFATAGYSCSYLILHTGLASSTINAAMLCHISSNWLRDIIGIFLGTVYGAVVLLSAKCGCKTVLLLNDFSYEI